MSASCLGLPTAAHKTHSKWMSLMRCPFEMCMRRELQKKQQLVLKGTARPVSTAHITRYTVTISTEIYTALEGALYTALQIIQSWPFERVCDDDLYPPQTQPQASSKHTQKRALVVINGYGGVTPAASRNLVMTDRRS